MDAVAGEPTRILFLAYYFPPAGGAGVQRALSFARRLPAEGFVPTVICGATSPAERWTPSDATLLEGIPANVAVHCVQGTAPSDGRWRGRIGRLLMRPSAFSRWWIDSAVTLGRRIALGHELILATMSPFESGVAARALSAELGVPWVADLRDPWALDEMQVYPSGIHRRVEQRRMERLLSTAALIVMNTPEAETALKLAFPRLRHTPIVTITNGFDADDFEMEIAPRPDGVFRVVHTGYLHTEAGRELRRRRLTRALGGSRADVDILTRSHATLLAAFGRWFQLRPDVREKVEVVLAGVTSAGDREIVESSAMRSLVRFPGYLTHRESVDLLRTADLLFLPMHDLAPGQRSRIVPGKTYEYMASGRPILAAVPEGDARDFLVRSGTALICSPNDTQSMVDALDRAYDAWTRGEDVGEPDLDAVARFDRKCLAHALAGHLRTVLAKDAVVQRTEIPSVRADGSLSKAGQR